jgi:hypothetical protein
MTDMTAVIATTAINVATHVMTTVTVAMTTWS